MNILFITASRIGDSVLSTGLLDHIARTHPDAKVTIVCGPLCTSLFEGYPLAERIISLKKQSYHRHWIKLWCDVVRIKWDMVVDLRDSVVSRLIRADQRFISGSHIDKTRHKVEQNASVMKLDGVPTPKLWFTSKQLDAARTLIPAGELVIAIGPVANWRAKTWPADRFVELVERLMDADEKFSNARIAVFAAPDEAIEARKVLNALPQARVLDVIGQVNPGTAAAALSLCDYYIGNDSGLMHCAAAAGVRTLGLFGPSYPHIYCPWGEHAQHVSTPQSFDELINYKGYNSKTAPCLMKGLSVESVVNAFDIGAFKY